MSTFLSDRASWSPGNNYRTKRRRLVLRRTDSTRFPFPKGWTHDIPPANTLLSLRWNSPHRHPRCSAAPFADILSHMQCRYRGACIRLARVVVWIFAVSSQSEGGDLLWSGKGSYAKQFTWCWNSTNIRQAGNQLSLLATRRVGGHQTARIIATIHMVKNKRLRALRKSPPPSSIVASSLVLQSRTSFTTSRPNNLTFFSLFDFESPSWLTSSGSAVHLVALQGRPTPCSSA